MKLPIIDLIRILKSENKKLSGINKGQILNVIYEGEETNQQAYLRNIKKQCEAYGITLNIYNLDNYPKKFPLRALKTGYVLPLKPLGKLNTAIIRKNLDPKRDIDNFLGTSEYGCTIESVIRIMRHYDLFKKSTVIIGRNLGKEVFDEILKLDCSPKIIHSKTPQIQWEQSVNNAELIISCVGNGKEILQPKHVCYSEYLINVGFSDVSMEIENDEEHHIKLTPRRNGVGGMTAQVLMSRILRG